MRAKLLTDTLVALFRAGHPVILKGKPGVGKTDIVGLAAELADCDLYTSHPVTSSPVDYKGMPAIFREKDGSKTAEFLPFDDLKVLIEAKDPTVYFMDDFGQAPSSVQAAAMQLIRARRLNNFAVSKHIRFAIATNEKGHRAAVSGILEPVKSRFTTILTLESNSQDWIQWAAGEGGIDERVYSFIGFRPMQLDNFQPTSDITNSPSPRTVENVSLLLQTPGLPDDALYESISGAAGEGFAGEFMGFLEWYKNVPDPDMALKTPDRVDIPSDPGARQAFIAAVASKVQKDTMDNYINLLKRLPADEQVVGVLLATSREETLKKTRAYIGWLRDNSDVIL